MLRSFGGNLWCGNLNLVNWSSRKNTYDISPLPLIASGIRFHFPDLHDCRQCYLVGVVRTVFYELITVKAQVEY